MTEVEITAYKHRDIKVKRESVYETVYYALPGGYPGGYDAVALDRFIAALVDILVQRKLIDNEEFKTLLSTVSALDENADIELVENSDD